LKQLFGKGASFLKMKLSTLRNQNYYHEKIID